MDRLGAVCQVGGPWEQELHISCLEMLATFLALKCFLRKERSIHILLKMDNTSAVAYINKKGGTVSPALNHLNKEFWLWCMEREITAFGWNPELHCGCRINNNERQVRLDALPKHFPHNYILGPLEVDLFASRLTTPPL